MQRADVDEPAPRRGDRVAHALVGQRDGHPLPVDLVGDEMARVWRLYLVGGRMAFRDGRMGVEQITATRPR